MNRQDAERALGQLLAVAPPAQPLTHEERSWFLAAFMETTVEAGILLRKRFVGYQFPSTELFEDHRAAILAEAESEDASPASPLEWIARSRSNLARGAS